jgi:hypothetical protein
VLRQGVRIRLLHLFQWSNLRGTGQSNRQTPQFKKHPRARRAHELGKRQIRDSSTRLDSNKPIVGRNFCGDSGDSTRTRFFGDSPKFVGVIPVQRDRTVANEIGGRRDGVGSGVPGASTLGHALTESLLRSNGRTWWPAVHIWASAPAVVGESSSDSCARSVAASWLQMTFGGQTCCIHQRQQR